MKCFRCRRNFLKKDLHFISERKIHICCDCADEKYHQCDECGTYHELMHLEYINQRFICSKCLKSNYFYCKNCYKHLPLENAAFINEDMVCKECKEKLVATCDICQMEVPEIDLISVCHQGYTDEICPDCLENNFFYCDHCGELNHQDELNQIGNKNFCSSCASEYAEENMPHEEYVEEENQSAYDIIAPVGALLAAGHLSKKYGQSHRRNPLNFNRRNSYFQEELDDNLEDDYVINGIGSLDDDE